MEEGSHAMYMVEEESSQSGDSGTHFYFFKKIDNNAHQSYQLVHKQIFLKSPTSVMVLPWN